MKAKQPAQPRRSHGMEQSPAPPRDLVIVGAGPIGLACAIEAKRAGLDAVVIEKANGDTETHLLAGFGRK